MAQHVVQQTVRRALENLPGAPHGEAARDTDGCSIPTYAISLSAQALGFARFGTGVGLSSERQIATRRIRRAVAQQPFMVAGADRFDTKLMQVLKERAFVKSGAERVYCAALPELGCGIALKIDDGTPRASAAAMATLILHLLPLGDWERIEVEALAQPVLKNWNGIEVGVSNRMPTSSDPSRGTMVRDR